MRMDKEHVLVVASLCGLAVATVGFTTNVAGVFFTPMADEFGILRGSASLTLTIANICAAIGGLFTRKIVHRMNVKAMLISFCALLVAATAGLALSPSILFAYLFSLLRGISVGVIGFVFIVYVLNKWFHERLGLMSSIAMGMSGLAGAIFAPILTPVVASAGWRVGYLVVAALTALFCLPALFFVPAIDPTDAGLMPYGAKADTDTEKAKATPSMAEPIHVDKLLAAGVMLYAILAAAVSAMPQHFPGLAQEAGLSAAVGAAMVSACMVTNTLGKILMGWLCDTIGARASILAFTSIIAASILALMGVHAPWAFAVASFFFGLTYARATVGLTMINRECFSKRAFDVVYPVAALCCSFSNAVFSSVVGFAFDVTGGYTVSLLFFLACLAVSALVVIWCYRRASHTQVQTA